MPPAYEDDTEGRNPNDPRRLPIPGDAGFTVTLEDGPLHGRDARLRDSAFRLWYVVDRLDRPVVLGAVASPPLEPGQRILGYYAFREADETAVWHRSPDPSEPFVTMHTPKPDPFRLVVLACAIATALALVVLARRPLPGRYVLVEGTAILDTQTGMVCRPGIRVGVGPDCAPSAPVKDSAR